MKPHYPNVIAYNNIPRMELKFRALSTGEEKEDTATKIQGMGTGDKTQMLNLLGKLVAIKYYRQTGCLNNVEDPHAQNQLWEEIRKEGLLPGGLKLTNLMEFIKNDGYIFQKKIPSTFKALLLSLNNEQKQNLIDKFMLTCQKISAIFLQTQPVKLGLKPQV